MRAANAGVSRLRRARRGPIRRRRRLLLLPAALGALNLQARLHELLPTRDGVALVVALGGGGDVDGAGGVAGGGGARRGKRPHLRRIRARLGLRLALLPGEGGRGGGLATQVTV